VFSRSPADELVSRAPESGLFHIWQSAGPSAQLCPERVLLSIPVVQAALGEHHGVLLVQGGLVYSFGELLWKDLSVPASAPVLEGSLLGRVVVRVAAGGFHCGAVSEQGHVYTWGENTGGQFSEPSLVSVVDHEVIPPAAVRVVDLAFGREHSLALSAQNELWAWGSGCQLGLVTTTFPVCRPQKVEHLAGRHVIQVVCGAYHSLALVRSLPPNSYNSQKPSEKRERGHSPHYSAAEREELFVGDSSLYCPLGVELKEGMATEVSYQANRLVSTCCCYMHSNPVIVDCPSHSNFGVTLPCSSSSLCLDDVRLCLESGLQVQPGKKLSSLSNKHYKAKSAGTRRHSVPGTPTLCFFLSGSPRRQRANACGKSSGGQTQAGAPEEDDDDGLPSLDTEVWSWGRGSEGQLGHGDQLARLQPLCIKTLSGEEVIQVAAGSHHSLAVTATCQVYSWGSNMCGQLGHDNSSFVVPQQAKLSDGLRVWDMSAGQSHSLLLADGDCVQPVLLYCGRQKESTSDQREKSYQRSPRKAEHYTVRPTLLPVCLEMGYISSVCSGGQSCAVLADQNIKVFISALHELASRERQFYCWLSRVRKLVLTPIQNKGDPCTHLFSSLCGSFSQLSVLIGRHSTSLTYFLQKAQGRDVTSLPLLTHMEQFLDTYKECLILQLSQLMPEFQSFRQGCGQYESLSLSLLRKKKEAESTFLFWKSHSGKTTESLRLPRRRVVCESSSRSLTLQKAGRFSNHWFILFNDALVHTQFSTHHVYPLTCLWVKPVTDDSILLSLQNKWLRSINHALDQVLGGSGEGSSPGTMGMSRTASYTFTGEGRFKDAKYSGSWMSGRVQGRGSLRWPDGRTYCGNFKNGLEDGYGECVIPNKELNKPDSYHGHWREGKIHGFGKYKYASGEVYEGCFSEGQRHGYGMLSSGKLGKKSSSVFIGHWVHDKKTGYGVFDDITRGEKYMGLWVDEKRHGSGVVVTQYGVYYEGTFRDNKMSGPGLLMSDDDTAIHGEFSDDWVVNGKGVLLLANGDCLEGLFSGEWTSGLKVDGTYTKPLVDEPVNKERKNMFKLGRYVVPAGQRWVCVFEECWSRLGCDSTGRGDKNVAWENIAVSITAARRQSPDLSRSQNKVLESLEFIPQHEQPVTTSNYDSIRRYLIKACETPLHPLGWLVETLVTVYRMTYVGVEANRRLLEQAVQELQAYLTHLYNIVQFLFPGMPDDGAVIPDPPGSCATLSHSDRKSSPFLPCCSAVVVSCSSLLLPLLLPRLYPPLFTLYRLQEEQEDALYWDRILRLNKQPDQSLLSFLGVQEKFWPTWMSILGEKKQVRPVTRQCLGQGRLCFTTFTPSDKLVVIQKTFEELTQEVNPMLDGHFLWCMDDLLPLFIYVVVRARIRNLGAEVDMIEDLMDPNVQHGELGLMFTTLKACYIQIKNESTT
uniref:Alsin Rho guanine nucleotide exchange factor ALS2 n=1 Tax=Takifugu rubripes TaxID=31033 RepID=A0A674NA68_TAKRU